MTSAEPRRVQSQFRWKPCDAFREASLGVVPGLMNQSIPILYNSWGALLNTGKSWYMRLPCLPVNLGTPDRFAQTLREGLAQYRPEWGRSVSPFLL